MVLAGAVAGSLTAAATAVPAAATLNGNSFTIKWRVLTRVTN